MVLVFWRKPIWISWKNWKIERPTRHGQKGGKGRGNPREDMPFFRNDWIMNKPVPKKKWDFEEQNCDLIYRYGSIQS